MLAGRMKLNHFLLIVGGVALCGGGGSLLLLPVLGGVFWAASAPQHVSPVAAPAIPATAVSAPAVAPATAPATVTVPADAARPWDAFLIGKQGVSIGGDKVKDATGGTAYKVNLYQDTGSGAINRAKVDYDRDEKWDEKWTYSADGIERQVAPADDERYTETWKWSGNSWQRK